ncbi:CHAD domain-containing protein [Roseibium hamelinense]|uniref:CHAD domain-containing protein n=1 Tax=Roseibium hamelinense TaxID=150831 RepID=A0A562T9Q3_9HYPH|nr:cell surface protein [Roseibium hamelinense]MTI45219.1 cell surface protein [Roseibium hamelinense]TWI90417.1 CHAD domain-containing protein [Roseibium hamelinense]
MVDASVPQTGEAAPASSASLSPLQYLDRALGKLRDIGITPETEADAPINALLEQISDLSPDKVLVITRTLGQASQFNEVVRSQVQQMDIGERYEAITESFNSIRDDAKSLVDQLADGKISLMENLSNKWRDFRRGTISDRFDDIRNTYKDVAKATKDQIEREQTILEAYRDFRGALKQAEVTALELLKTATDKLNAAKTALENASNEVTSFAGDDAAAKARLELARDERLREMQDEEKRYQIAKDLSDNLTIGYNTSEIIMARLMQTTNAKERVYAQSVSFFSTNESVLTALNASFTGLQGLHESTETLNAMKDGVNKSLETLAEIGDAVQKEALKAGYGPTVQAASVKKLVDSVVNFQVQSREIINEMREMSTKNSEEIRTAVEDGKRRLAKLAAEGNALRS